MAIWFLIHPRGLVLRRDGEAVELPTDDDARHLGAGVDDAHELGTLEGERALAAGVDETAPIDAPVFVAGPAEMRAIHRALGEERFRLAGVGNQLVHWAGTHRFCGRCATRTERMAEERALRCPACGLIAYPRISPAVIVLVRRGTEALLARGSSFPVPFYSTLAGFVEVGETLEDTVAREVREEVGIEVERIRYFGSQPWPFPHSLMIAFNADWKSGELAPDVREILDARWFRAADLPTIPPRLSIARRLIDAWVDDVASSPGG